MGRKVASSESEKNIVWWCWRKTATGWWSWCTQLVAIFATFLDRSSPGTVFCNICSKHWVRTVVFRYLTCQRMVFSCVLAGVSWPGCATVERNSEPPCLRSPGKSAVQVQEALPDVQMQRLLGWLVIFQIYEPSVCESCPHMSFSWKPSLGAYQYLSQGDDDLGLNKILECFMKKTMIYSPQIFS